MCGPVAIPIAMGIASLGVGVASSVSSYNQQNNAAAMANQQAWQSTLAQNRQIEAQSFQNLNQNIFQLQQSNFATNFQNQNITQQSIMQSGEVFRANANLDRQFYQEQTNTAYANLNSQLEYTSLLNKSILSKNVADLQLQMNQRGLSAELEDSQRRLRDAQQLAAFDAEKLLVSNLKSQGSVLASGRSGGSIGLAIQSVDAAYGRDLGMVGTNFQNRVDDFYSEATNAFMKKTQADFAAMSEIIPEPSKRMDIQGPSSPIYASLPEKPIYARYQTELAPMAKPIFAGVPVMQRGASGLGLAAGIGGAVLGGVQTGMQADATIKQAGWFG
jgi:hypothetical protein